MGRVDDPWGLDLDAITDKLARGDFDAYDVDPLPRRSVSLAAGPGTWILESPFQPARAAEAGGNLLLAEVPLGLHTLFSLEGHRIRFAVSENEVVVIRGEDKKTAPIPAPSSRP